MNAPDQDVLWDQGPSKVFLPEPRDNLGRTLQQRKEKIAAMLAGKDHEPSPGIAAIRAEGAEWSERLHRNAEKYLHHTDPHGDFEWAKELRLQGFDEDMINAAWHYVRIYRLTGRFPHID